MTKALADNTMQNMFIHCGMLKTATTTLQNHYFAHHPDLHFIGKPTEDTVLYAAINHLCRADGINYDPEFVSQRLSPVLEKARQSGKVIGLSDEKFTMHHRGDRKLVAERLRDHFGPNTKIILTFRRQMGVIDSLYLLESRNAEEINAAMRPKSWLQFQINANGILQTLDYFNLYKTYVSIFGEDNVKVLFFEQFVRDRSGFLREMANFCGIDPHDELLSSEQKDNSRLSQRWFAFTQFKHKFLGEYVVKLAALLTPESVLKRFRSFLRAGPSAKVKWPGDIEPMLNNLYVEGNRKLAEALGVDLAQYG